MRIFFHLRRRIDLITGRFEKDAPLAGARAGGSMLERRAAAAQASRVASRLAITSGILRFLSKASGVVGAAGTSFSVGARMAFIEDCKTQCPECQ